MKPKIIPTLCLGISVFGSTAGYAVTVHTWKDAQGVTHFSDEPGPVGTPSNEIVLDKIAGQSVQADDYYSIANQWQRLKSEKDLAAKNRLEKQQLAAAERARKAEFERQSAAQQLDYAPTYPVFGRGLVYHGGGYHRGYGLPSFGLHGADRHHRVQRHPNYHSPFHDRVQPQSIRPKSTSRNQNSYRGRGASRGGFFVQF